MGSIESSGEVVQEILLNNYLKGNFENYFAPTFWNFIMGKFSYIIASFLNFKYKYLENRLW